MNDSLSRQVEDLRARRQDHRLKQLLLQQDTQTLADLIEGAEGGRRKMFSLLPPEVQAATALVLPAHVREEVLPQISDHTVARFLHFIDEDEATDILQSLPEERRPHILAKMTHAKRESIERLLRYDAETAGGLMDFNFLTVSQDALVRDVIERVQRTTKRYRHVPIVIVTGHDGRVLGSVPERHLIGMDRNAPLSDFVEPIPLLEPEMDREAIVLLTSRRRSDQACVVGPDGKPLGVVHLRDLLKVALAEATEDVYRFAGVGKEEDAFDAVHEKVRRRAKWLVINLGTAFIASLVVARFQGTIEKVAVLAVYMPIVAGQGGNAATQALAVVVRSMAQGEIGWPEARQVILREALAGMLNGMVTGSIAAFAAALLHGNPLLGFVLGTAMVINLFIAGLFGALVPVVLRRSGIDPAVASSIFVTTATDFFGFLTFLGLGSLLLAG